MPSHRGLFAQIEPGFWLNDPRVRELSPPDRSYYADLWVMTVLQRCEVIRGWRQACRRLWASTYRAVDLIVGRLASPSPGRGPLVEILSDELLRVCGSAKVHKRASRGTPVVRTDVDVDVDKDVEGDVDVDRAGATPRPEPKTPKPRDTDSKATASHQDEKSDTAPAPAPAGPAAAPPVKGPEPICADDFKRARPKPPKQFDAATARAQDERERQRTLERKAKERTVSLEGSDKDTQMHEDLAAARLQSPEEDDLVF